MSENITQVIEDYFAEVRRDGYIVDGVDPRELGERIKVEQQHGLVTGVAVAEPWYGPTKPHR